jgi:hypothetical protein
VPIRQGRSSSLVELAVDITRRDVHCVHLQDGQERAQEGRRVREGLIAAVVGEARSALAYGTRRRTTQRARSAGIAASAACGRGALSFLPSLAGIRERLARVSKSPRVAFAVCWRTHLQPRRRRCRARGFIARTPRSARDFKSHTPRSTRTASFDGA